MVGTYTLLDGEGPLPYPPDALGTGGLVDFKQKTWLASPVGTIKQSPETEAEVHPGDKVHLSHVSYRFRLSSLSGDSL